MQNISNELTPEKIPAKESTRLRRKHSVSQFFHNAMAGYMLVANIQPIYFGDCEDKYVTTYTKK